MIFDSLGSGLAGFSAARTTRPDEVYQPGGGMFGLSFQRPIAGVPISRDSALTYSAVWACTEIITNHIAMMPWRVFERRGDVRRVASDHPADAMLYRVTNDETNSYEFRKALVLSALMQGNGFAEIERTRAGDPAGLWFIDRDRVDAQRDRRGRLVYEVSESNGPNKVFKPSELIHLRGGPTVDGVMGLSVIDYARQSLSHGLAVDQFGAAFFGNGAMPGGVIEWDTDAAEPDGWDGDAAKNQKKTWLKQHKGAKNYGGLQILEPGQRFKAISITPEQAQFIETGRWKVTDVCRWFNVKPHKIAELERSTNNNIESENVGHVTDTLLPCATRLEQEVDFKLFGRDTRYYNKINLSALLRGDLKARKEFYQSMMDRGVYSIDEVRAFEDTNPLDDGMGKLRLVQMNMTSVEQAAADGNTGSKSGDNNAG